MPGGCASGRRRRNAGCARSRYATAIAVFRVPARRVSVQRNEETRAPPMEMHQVRYFVALCETLNFTRAAEKCNVTQPSLTRAIKLLEEELGGPLFNRERNQTHLTELGRMMEPHLREVIEQARHGAGAGHQLLHAAARRG